MPSKYKLVGILLGIVLGGLLAISYFHVVQKPPRSGVGLAVDTAQGALPLLAQYPHRASSCYQEYYPINLSDNNPDSFWHVFESIKPAWAMIDFGTDSGDVINSFRALPRKNAPAQFWRQAVLQGSNNARYWTNLADVSVDKEPASAEWFTWYFDARRNYRYYRLFITSGFDQGKYFVSFAEWQFNHCDLSEIADTGSIIQMPGDSLLNVLRATPGPIALGVIAVGLLAMFGMMGWRIVLLRNEIKEFAAPVLSAARPFMEWRHLQVLGSRKVFVASILLLTVLCSYGLPLFGGFTWSASVCAPTGSIDYRGRHPGGANGLAFDVATPSRFTEPRNHLLSAYLRNGMLPLWNPYETTGLPFAADFESKALFPLNLLQALMPYRIWDAFYLLRVYLAGLFVYLLLRQYNLAVPVSLFGATTYMLSGPIALNLPMEETTNGAFIVPWLIYASERLASRHTSKCTFGLAIPIALIIYAGQPKLALLAISCSFVYLFARSVHLNGISPGKVIDIGLRAVLSLLVGLLLAAPQVLLSAEYSNRACALPTLFLLDDSVKSNSSTLWPMLRDAYNALSLHGGGEDTGGLLLTLLPNFWGFLHKPWVALYREMGWWTHPAYIGVTATFFIFFAISAYRRYESQHRFLVSFFTCLCFILVSGNYGFPLTRWVQVFAYGGYLRHYAPVFVLSSVIVASLGVELFCIGERDFLRKKLITALALLVGFAVLTLLLPAFSHGRGVYKSADLILSSHCIIKSVLVLAMVILTIRLLGTRFLGPNMGWCVAILGFCELALYVPYGFGREWDAYRMIPLVIGITAVFSLACARTRLLVTSVLLYVTVMFFLIVMSPRGLYAWHNSFKQPPYVSLLKGQGGEFRTYGIESPFVPNYTSVFQIKDIRSFAPFFPLEFAQYMKKLLCPSQRPTMFDGWAWGVYPYFLTPLGEYYQYKRFYDFLGVRYLTTGNRNRLDIEPFPYLGEAFGRGHRGLHLKKGDVLNINLVDAPPELCGIAWLATSCAEEGAELPFRLTGADGELLKEDAITLGNFSPAIKLFPTIRVSQGVELTLRLSKEYNARYYPDIHNNTMTARVNGDTVPGVIGFQIFKPRQDIRLVYDEELRIYENKEAYPRAYMVYNIGPFSTLEELWTIDMRTTALVDGVEKKITTRPPVSPTDGAARILTYTPHRIVIEVEAKASGLLVFTDTYYPGWKAHVDGKQEEIHRVNGLVRGVWINTEGRHTVEFVYRPMGLYLGGILSLSTLMVMLITTRRRNAPK